MTVYYNSVVRELTGDVDGVNRVFTTTSRYVSGTIRVVVNGQVYFEDEDIYGWDEVDDQTIRLHAPPVETDIVQAFYQDKDSEHIGLENVIGSPFDPRGILP